ncbi:MAG: hypothetical protein Q9201_001264 [Fulgogasparrea decipioides]
MSELRDCKKYGRSPTMVSKWQDTQVQPAAGDDVVIRSLLSLRLRSRAHRHTFYFASHVRVTALGSQQMAEDVVVRGDLVDYNYPASSKSGVVTPVNRELPTQYKPHIRSGNHVKSGFHPRYQWKKLLIVLTAVAALQKGKRKSANGRESKSSGIPSIEDLPLRPLRNLKQRMTAAAKHRSDVPPFVSDEGTPGSANMKAGKSEFLRLTFGPFQSLADPIRLSSEEPNRLAGSEVSKSINAPLLQVFDQQTMQKRRECLFTDAEKEHMSKIRKAGACLECRQRKVKVSFTGHI